MNKLSVFLKTVLTATIIVIIIGCDDKTTDIHNEHEEFESIEHGCIHMMDEGDNVDADSTMPGPHLDEEDFEHTRLKVALVEQSDDSYLGYIHFGPDITGDMYVMTSEDVPLAVTNRTGSGDTELKIEETFSAQQIADEADCDKLKKAIVFEAEEGGNIIKIGPTTFDTISVIIEEGDHGHEH